MNDRVSGSRPHVLAILPGFTASTLMDVVSPMLDLEKVGKISFKASLEFYTPASDVEKTDLVIFCRNTDPLYRHLPQIVEQRKIPYIYDLDDDLFEIPENTSLKKYYRTPERRGFLTRYLAGASLVRVYSSTLLEKVKLINPNVVKVTEPLNWNFITIRKPVARPQPVKIVYATSRKEDPLSTIFVPALTRILDEYGERVEMHFLGYLPDGLGAKPNVRFTRFRQNYHEFLRDFSRQGYDIGLAPMLDDKFHRSKTNNKFREYAACSIAAIFSNVTLYSSCIRAGETGMLVENSTDAWYNALKLLIEDETMRRQIGQAAREFVLGRYSQAEFCETWHSQIMTILDGSRELNKDYFCGEVENPIGETRLGNRLQHKASQVWNRLRTNSVKELAQTFALQVQDLYFLYKINRLKRF